MKIPVNGRKSEMYPISVLRMWPQVLYVMMMLSFNGMSGESTACNRDEQCHEGDFCDKSAKICRVCISCENLKREPPPNLLSTTCITSVSMCGGCLKGLAVNLLGDVNSECVPAVSQADDAVLPAYVWVLIAIALLFFVIIIVAVVYVLRNKETIKMISWMERQYSEPPPPYNPRYSAVRPESPAPHAPSDLESQFPPNTNNNADTAFIKRNPLPEHHHAFEKEGNQEALVYNPPAYSLGDQSPSSDPPTVTELNDNFENAMLHDEDTVESVWSPYVSEENATPSNPTSGNIAVPVPDRPNKKLYLSQDTNNNRNCEANASTSENSSSGSGFSCSPPPTQAKPSFVINVVQINNSK